MTFKPIKVATVTNTTVKVEPLGYKFFKRSKHSNKLKTWIARKFWDLLDKWGYLEQYHTVYETNIYGHKEFTDITEALISVVDNLIRNNLKIEDYALLMGSEEFYLLSRIGILGHYTFPVDRINYGGYGDTGERYMTSYNGLMVHVVSTVSGIHAVPKVYIEKKQGETSKIIQTTVSYPWS